MAVEGSGGDCRGSELYRYCNSSLASYVDATVFNPNVNPFHPANQLSGVPGGYKPEVLLPLELHFPAMPNDRPLIIPGPVIDAAELADLILDTFPVILPGLDTLIEIFPAVERDFFQNVVCTESTGDSKTTSKTKHGDQRLRERGFTDEKAMDIMENYTQKVYQQGGKTVYAKKNGNYYDVIITNAEGEIVTAVGGNSKSLKTWKDVIKMLNNNGGYSTLPY